jgi:UDPglucose 6-dehydrogenase
VALTAFDPVVTAMPADLSNIRITRHVPEAIEDADAVIVATEWPQLLDTDWRESVGLMKQPIIVDANGFLKLSGFAGLIYRSVGIPKTL